MQPDTFYHIYNHANGSENIFLEEKNYFFFLQQWAKFIEPVAGTYAYCLMPNHFHFLVKIHSEKYLELTFGKFETFRKLESQISKSFGNFFSSYTQAFNKMYNRRGSLMMPKFKRKEIINDEYLTAMVHYIHHNPIHHGFCENFEKWPHSSYQLILSNKPSKLKRAFLLDWFGSTDEFIKYHKSNIRLPDKSILIDM